MEKNYNYNENRNDFTREMINDTLKYQKLYGFDIGENNNAHNNQADAFRHTYMQCILSLRYGTIPTKTVSSAHEVIGNIRQQDPREANMDLWNNQQGQQIYNEIRIEHPYFLELSEQRQKDIIAKKVVQRMKEGKLITNIDDPRKFAEQKPAFIPTKSIGGIKNNCVPLGFAAPIENNTNQSDLSDYTNPLTGNNRIFTREDIEAMSNDEFAKYEKEIDAQISAMKGFMPTNNDLEYEVQYNGGVVYVHPYTRSDGTEVKGYYRSKPKF